MNEHSHAEFEQVLRRAAISSIEWPTLALIATCHAAWLAAGLFHAAAPWLATALLALPIALHSSLQHEAIHRHPTRSAAWNEALVFLPIGLLIPYRRYRETHLAHHVDFRITDPYDDPESFYWTAAGHQRLPGVLRLLLAWNATLAGRIVIGPAIAAVRFLLAEARLGIGLRGAAAHAWREAWALHLLGLMPVLAVIHFVFAMPLMTYLGAVYLAMALLGLRGFAEHRWAEAVDARSVIIERSWLGWLFLHNNLHFVHHKQPHLPWYVLPDAYRAHSGEWLALNEGYVFPNYRAVFAAYGLWAKEPVVHPAHQGLPPSLQQP